MDAGLGGESTDLVTGAEKVMVEMSMETSSVVGFCKSTPCAQHVCVYQEVRSFVSILRR